MRYLILLAALEVACSSAPTPPVSLGGGFSPVALSTPLPLATGDESILIEYPMGPITADILAVGYGASLGCTWTDGALVCQPSEERTLPQRACELVNEGSPNSPIILDGQPITATGDLADALVRAPMGCVKADLDGDGHDDLVITNDPDIKVLRGDGRGGYTYVGGTFLDEPHNAINDLLSWEVVATDLDGDGRLDLCFSNGMDLDRFLGQNSRPKNRSPMWPTCYWNAGSFQFADVTVALGLDKVTGEFHGLRTADVNKDGKPDLLVGGCMQPPMILLRSTN